MDPNQAWIDLREAITDHGQARAEEIADGLLGWLVRGGFPPSVTGHPAFDRLVVMSTCRQILSTANYVVLVKTKQPQVQRLTTVRNEHDQKRLGDIVQQVDRALTAGVFFPIESPMNCSGCAYRVPCREWRCQESTDTFALAKQKALDDSIRVTS